MSKIARTSVLEIEQALRFLVWYPRALYVEAREELARLVGEAGGRA